MSAIEALRGIEDLDREEVMEKSLHHVDVERQCKITLAKDWKAGEKIKSRRVLELAWNPGGRSGRKATIYLEPGKSTTQPLWKVMVWLGPFGLLDDYRKASDEKERDFLRAKYANEKLRILNRYDYPRPINMTKDGVEPVGPHRFPDVTCTVIDADGIEGPPIRLHECYKIGEFDEAYPLDSFGNRETVEQVKARYEKELTDQAASFQKQFAEMQKQFAEMGGMVKGLAVAVQASGKEK